MPAEKEHSQLPIASLIAVMLALGGIWLSQSPLKSSRPDHGPPLPSDSSQARIAARLWQDPFAVIEQHAKRLEKIEDPWALQQLEDRIRVRPGHFGVDKATVLLVMLEKSPNAEDAEQRLRVRYTVGVALNSAGFTPEDSTTMSYFVAGMTLVPYELYRNVHKDGDHYSVENVLVVWVPESNFATLIQVQQAIRNGLTQPNLKLIGPRTTTTLFEMHADAVCNPDLEWNHLDGMELFSYRATTHPSIFGFESVHQAAFRCKELQQLMTPDTSFAQRGMKFNRTVGSDDVLANELLAELTNRGLSGLNPGSSYDPCTPSMDKIALISEADTFYGRVLPATFAASLSVKKGYTRDFDAAFAQIKTDPQRWPCSLVTYTYLNGLDGEVPGDDRKAKKQSQELQAGRRDASLPNYKNGTKESPEGPSQLDYAIRLAEKIKSDSDLNFQNGMSTFRAIGILGSDVYDKLLLLQALRRRLPNAIFFTTDLDARLWHDSEFEWTRNLLVASHYDVQLSNQWSQELHVSIAPFRDGYQTALYLSTLQAVGWLQDKDNNGCLMLKDSTNTFSRDSAPKLYEIGRRGPVDISVRRDPVCKVVKGLPVNPDRPNVVPGTMTLWEHRFGILAVAAMLTFSLGLMLVLALPTKARAWAKGHRPFLVVLVALITVFATYLVVQLARYLLLCDASNADKELEVLKILPINPDRPNVAPRAMTLCGHRFGFLAVAAMLTLSLGSILVLVVRPLWVRVDALLTKVQAWGKGQRPFRVALVTFVTVLASYLLVRLVRYLLLLDKNGAEPFSVTDSVSIWPTEVIRLIGIALAVSFFVKGAGDLRLNRDAIRAKYLTGTEKSLPADTKSAGRMAGLSAACRHALGQLKSWPVQMSLWRSVDRWVNTKPIPSPQASVDANVAWDDYLRSGQPCYAVCRIGLVFVAYMIFGSLLFLQVEPPLRPCRGAVSCAVDKGLLILTIFFSVLLSLWVFDLVRRCIALIEHITAHPIQWPSDVLEKHTKHLNVPPEFLTQWLDIQFIADRTRVVGGMVVYPFIVFVVVLSARNRYFDNWDFPVPLIVVLTLNALLILATALLLKRAAEQARTIAIHQMNELLISEKGHGKDKTNRAEQLQLMVDEVQNIRRGAFNNVFQQPAVTASLLGALALLQYFLPL